ncbi:hypothetical protein [Marinicella marina]|uniref:hypothetical protein n=1 Tax=Marinicella marina TaxID=2996016 RepID=UPI002260A8D0|nr:hypothetical protein [Marinicella marina]
MYQSKTQYSDCIQFYLINITKKTERVSALGFNRMGKVKRYIAAALVGSVITLSLVFFMIALITLDDKEEPIHNILTT